MLRELGHQGFPTFGVKGVSRDKVTKQITSVPHVHHQGEIPNDLGHQLNERLTATAAKSYPKKTALIHECSPNAIILDQEWHDAIRRLRATNVSHPFKEVFLFCDMGRHSSTI